MDYFLIITISIVTFLLGLFTKSFLPSYFNEKGKNLATKEDINEITHIVEQIKTGFSKDLEFVKLQLTKQATIHRLIIEKEVCAIAEVNETLVELKFATIGLRPVFDFVPTDETKKQEMYEERYKNWAEKHNLFLASLEKQRLFLPQNIYKKLWEIKTKTVEEGVGFETDFRYGSDKTKHETYKISKENIELMQQAIDNLTEIIHQRYEIEDLTNVLVMSKNNISK